MHPRRHNSDGSLFTRLVKSLTSTTGWWHRFVSSTSASLILERNDRSEPWTRNGSFGPITLQHKQLVALAKRLEEAREEERARVARDLHDDIGQLLTAVKMDLVWIGKHMADREAEAHERLGDAVELINTGVRSVRKICTGLHPSVLDDLGLAAAIEWQANEFSTRAGIACRLSLPGEPLNLTGDQAITIFRVFQESLTNIGRHAHAHNIEVSLYEEEGDLVLNVRDDGKGFSEAARASGLGMLGMLERAEACGGKLLIDSSPGKGTAVTLRVPTLSGKSIGAWSDSLLPCAFLQP